MKGGKREGAGRPPAPKTILVRVRLLPDLHKEYMERGADIWLKRVLSDNGGGNCNATNTL